MSTISAIVAACLCGQLGLLQSARDSTNDISLREKLKSALHFAEQRHLDAKLTASISAHFQHSWYSEMNLGDAKSGMLGLLSTPLASEVALELRCSIMDSVPFFQSASRPVRWHIALALRPEIVAPGTLIYDTYDIAEDIYFIDVGRVLVETDDKISEASTSTMSYAANLTHMALQYKHMYLPGDNDHAEGAQFGEYCIVSKRAIRMSKATASETTELYALSKKDFVAILSKMPHKHRCKLILDMFCIVGEVQHSEFPSLTEADETFSGNFTPAVMNEVSLHLLEAVVRKRAPLDASGEIAGLEKSSQEQGEPTGLNRRRAESMCSLESDDEGGEGRDGAKTDSDTSPWMMALMQYQRVSAKPADGSADAQSVALGEGMRGRPLSDLYELTAPDDAEAAAVIAEIKDLVRQMFVNVDADGSGHIDREELMGAFEEMGAHVTWEDVDRMIKAADVDGNETVDLEEVTAAVLAEVMKMRENLIKSGERATDATREIKSRATRVKTMVVESRKSMLAGHPGSTLGARTTFKLHNRTLQSVANPEAEDKVFEEEEVVKPSSMLSTALSGAYESDHSDAEDNFPNAPDGASKSALAGPTIDDVVRQSRSYAGVRLASLQNARRPDAVPPISGGDASGANLPPVRGEGSVSHPN